MDLHVISNLIKMKRYLQLFSFIVFFASFSNGQKMKIAQAEYYFKGHRYSDATPIYKELIEKDGLLPESADSIFRHAGYAAERSKNYNFAFFAYSTLFKDSKGNFDDAYNLFRISLLLGDYSTAQSVLSSEKIKLGQDERRIILEAYHKGDVWNELKAVGTGDKIDTVGFNSRKGDFATSWHPDGLVISSGRFPSGAKWEQDNSSFLNSYLYNDSLENVSMIGILRDKKHDGTAFYDAKKNQWYYAKNYDAAQGEYAKTGIYIYDALTQNEIAFPYNAKTYFVAQPYLSEDGKVLWFSSDMPGGYGNADIWYSIKKDSIWSKPVNAGSKINTFENEMFPVVNGSRLYFSSNGHPGFGGLDLFKTKLVNFVPEKIENMGVVVNSYADDFTLLLDPERKNGYLSSSRYEYIDHVYAITLTPLTFLYDAKLKVDIASTKALNEIPVLITENNVVIDTIYPDKDGHFTFVGEEDKSYKMEINDPKFFSVTDLYSTVGKTESDTVYRDLVLKSKYIPLNTIVVDEKSKQPLVDADVLIVNKITGEEAKLHTDDAGRLKTELLRDNNYEIIAGKPGFIKNSKDISTKTTAEKIDESIALKKISKGVKFEVENVLYDLGKATLRPESKVELNKIVLFLNENPTIKVELSSHTDSRGSDKSNQVLSQKRAQSCVDYLVSQGVSKNSIVAKGYGETQLLNKCKNGVQCDEAEHQRNRRTEIKVLSVQP